MAEKEAKARVKINELLKESGWRFFDDDNGNANIILENNIKMTEKSLNEFGEDFEKTKNGFIDFLLLDEKGFPLVVLEAKAEDKDPLSGKEQARKYANSQNCRFIILSNGNLHYFWDLERGNPNVMSKFPSPGIVLEYSSFKPDPTNIISEIIDKEYIVLTQKPDYKNDPSFLNEKERNNFIKTNHLSFLRPYQLKALNAIQESVKLGKDRFLFEMATGTGKTLVAAAVIKLFLRTSNIRRALFLVDRIELENQALKSFVRYLKNDYKCVIYKENRDDWRKAEIVISTVQTLLANNRYKRVFNPGDFDLVISDEAHRSIGGNSRTVFEYFIGYKLGLTATPKDYLKNIDPDSIRQDDPRELERRILLDTYKTFGCETGTPTFRYSLIDGVKDKYLVSPIVVDARTDISTRLLSDKGYSVVIKADENNDEEIFIQTDFERKFFSENTNRVFCKTFLENALRDPITNEIGKTIIFCVSQNHAARITQILNEYAYKIFPGKYSSDFALQVTSRVPGAQTYTVNFSNNNLSGSGNYNPKYKTGKTRVCVTVGMMTTGYDCTDLLNICLMRPIFSPTDFIQIKGRGTRKHDFTEQIIDNEWRDELHEVQKGKFKIFDFFANFEYFENEFDYDEILQLPVLNIPQKPDRDQNEIPADRIDFYHSTKTDILGTIEETQIGLEGMRIDRMYFQRFEETVKNNSEVKEKIQIGKWDEALKFIENNIFDKPEDFFNLEKLRKSIQIDRRLTLLEILQKIFGKIPYFKTKDELLEEEFDRFDNRFMPEEKYFTNAKNVFKSYLIDPDFRQIIDRGNHAMLNINPNGAFFKALTPELRKNIVDYIKDYVQLNQFIN
jgi:type I restriction enzyme R subunit